jgi:hypothetical protein
MAVDMDRQIVMTIISLDDAARSAGMRRWSARGAPTACVLSLADADDVPTGLTDEEQRVHDALAALADDELARVLALYWLGRSVLFGLPVDVETYDALLADAAGKVDDAPSYLTAKSNLGESLRRALVILGV